MSLDNQITIVTIVQVTALILLTIGVYPYRIRTKNRNLITHGFLSIVAIALNLTTIFWVMIPVFIAGIEALAQMNILQAAIVLLHASLGTAAIVLGFIMILSWITHPLGELGCAKTWRLMIPTFLVWAAVLVLGFIIHFYGLL